MLAILITFFRNISEDVLDFIQFTPEHTKMKDFK